MFVFNHKIILGWFLCFFGIFDMLCLRCFFNVFFNHGLLFVFFLIYFFLYFVMFLGLVFFSHVFFQP